MNHHLIFRSLFAGLCSFALPLGLAATVLAQPADEDQRVLTVKTLEANSQATFEKTRAFVGRVEAARSSQLGFELSGTVIGMTVEDGEHVTKDQVIAELDTARLKARKAQLEAALEETIAAEKLAKVTLERAETLVKSRATSEQNLDEARNQYSGAQARTKLVEAQIQQVDVDLSKSQIRAPFEGVISERMVDEGSIVTAGQPIYHLLETSQLEIRVGVSQQAIGSVDQGAKFELNTTAGPVKATVDRILSQRDAQTRTIDVVLKVDSSLADLRHGDLIQVPLSVESAEKGFWLPRTALTESQRGLWACYVAASPDQAKVHTLERRQLELLHTSEDSVFVRGALKDGDLVVVSGLQRLTPGQPVRLQPDGLAAN